MLFGFDEDGMGAGVHAYSVGPLTKDDVVMVPAEDVPEIFHRNAPAL